MGLARGRTAAGKQGPEPRLTLEPAPAAAASLTTGNDGLSQNGDFAWPPFLVPGTSALKTLGIGMRSASASSGNIGQDRKPFGVLTQLDPGDEEPLGVKAPSYRVTVISLCYGHHPTKAGVGGQWESRHPCRPALLCRNFKSKSDGPEVEGHCRKRAVTSSVGQLCKAP